MATLSRERLLSQSIPLSTSWLLSACAEAKGKQDLWIRQKPEVLAALREQAIVQSAESSNRIEGVTVDENRLRPLVLGLAKPRDRSEEEVAGYRKAMDWVFTHKRRLAVSAQVIQRLHSLAQGGTSSDAGKWKSRDNEIIEILPNGDRRVRFKPTSAKATPKAITSLCREYQALCENEQIPALMAVATFVFDLLCIHPFRDGNGRVSRLVTTMLLLEHGFEVVRYVSLERIVEESKSEYYQVLKRCSVGWHEDKNEIVSWWNYFLGTVRQAYQKFAAQVESSGTRSAKGDLVRHTVLAQVEPFSLAELHRQLPLASVQLVKKVLAAMKAAGEVRLTGRGRGALWHRVEE